jgi:hypothetical protein
VVEAFGEMGRAGETAQITRGRTERAAGAAAARAGAPLIEAIRKPQQAIAIAEQAVQTGNIQSRSDFEMLKRDWLMVKPYLTEEVIVALEPILLQKGGRGGGGSPAVTEG